MCKALIPLVISTLILSGQALTPRPALAADCTSHYSTRYATEITRCKSTVRAFKEQHPCPSTGKSYGACPGYVVDHVIALKRGGLDVTQNLQWMDTVSAREKDKWE